jgi:hypothetical protein
VMSFIALLYTVLLRIGEHTHEYTRGRMYAHTTHATTTPSQTPRNFRKFSFAHAQSRVLPQRQKLITRIRRL